MPDVSYFFPKVSKKDNTTQIQNLAGIFVLPGSQIDNTLLIGGCGQNLAHAQLWPYQFKRSSYATDRQYWCIPNRTQTTIMIRIHLSGWVGIDRFALLHQLTFVLPNYLQTHLPWSLII